MPSEYCHPLTEGEISNEKYSEWSLLSVTIHGSTMERIKLSKRLMCATKHLPMRLRIHYENDMEKSIEAGVSKDPTLTLNEKIFLEGLVQAEEITERFEEYLKTLS
jgi:hypothetical protein